MTDLAAQQLLPSRKSARMEEWHGHVLRGHLVACIVVKQGSTGKWKVTAKLQDVSFWPVWKTWQGGPFDTHDEAYEAGERAAARMHGAFMDARQRLSLYSC
jgi:hypothetical protein